MENYAHLYRQREKQKQKLVGLNLFHKIYNI